MSLVYSPRVKAGRCSNGYERDGGRVVHAVAPNRHAAVCGTAPGDRSAGWSEYPSLAVTCPKCLKKIARLEQMTGVV
jgi:hypothetical protein